MRRLLLLALALASTAILAAAPATPPLQAGAATSNITPPLGVLRVGGFAPYPTVHVNDELHARCLVLDDGNTRLALVVVDLLGIHRSVSIEARRLIQETTGIPPENVLISATHTHSGGNALGSNRYTNDQQLDDYQLFVARRISDGVQRAVNLLRPAQIAFGSIDVPEHVSNRRWHLREGSERENPFGKKDRVWKTGAPNETFTKPAGPVDSTVPFIALREPDGRLISVYSAYSLHYTGGAGPAHISADYFGFYSETLKKLQPDGDASPPFVAMMANATSGDIGLDQHRYRNLRAPYQRMETVGTDVARRVNEALAEVTWKNRAELGARYVEAALAWRPMGPELLAWAKEIEAQAPRVKDGNVPVGARWATTPEFVTRLSYAGRVQILAKASRPAKVPLQVLRIGDIGIGTSPCETYAEIGLEFKERSPFRHTFMVSLAHGYMGYLPTPRHFELGGYSTWPGTNYLEPQASVKMLDTLLELAGQIAPRSD